MDASTSRSLPAPTPLALVICDNVYADQKGKRALIGLFNRIASSAFPARHPKVCVFVSVTSLHAQTQCRLDVVAADTDDTIFATEGQLVGDSPNTICDLVFEIDGIAFPRPGKYYFRFFGNDEIIVQRPIDVVGLEVT